MLSGLFGCIIFIVLLINTERDRNEREEKEEAKGQDLQGGATRDGDGFRGAYKDSVCGYSRDHVGMFIHILRGRRNRHVGVKALNWRKGHQQGVHNRESDDSIRLALFSYI